MKPRFNVGDPVRRRRNVYSAKSPYRYGRITRVYSDHTSRFGPYPELYEVQWLDGSDKGYFTTWFRPYYRKDVL